MKLKFTFLLISTLLYSQTTFGNNLVAKLSNTDFGSWAYTRYNSICSRVHSGIENGLLKTISNANKKLNKDAALAQFKETYTVFLSTSESDPTQGKDTVVQMPITENFYAISLNKTQVIVQVSEKSVPVIFDRPEFENLLSQEDKCFLHFFISGSPLLLKQIPERSNSLLREMNLNIFLSSMKPETKVFKNDSLNSYYSQTSKEERGSYSFVSFISTDPVDPSAGRDTAYLVSIEPDLRDSSFNPFIYYLLSGNLKSLQLNYISCGFNARLLFNEIRLPMYLGFVPFEKSGGLNADQRAALEYAILHSIQDKLNKNYTGENYVKYFNLKSDE